MHVIRTSILGETLNKRNLIEWVKGNAGNLINGCINVLWNGITCLELIYYIEK